MMINKIKADLAVLKAEIEVKKALPCDYLCLLHRYRDEYTRRSVTKKIYAITGERYEEPETIELICVNMDGMSWQARRFLKLSDEEKAEAVDRDLPKVQISEEEAEECKQQLMAKINGIRERMRYNYPTT
jgi:hypothetical protein